MLDALTSELALEGYTTSETFGYTLDQLEQAPVHLVGARVDGRLVGLGASSYSGTVPTSSSGSSWCRRPAAAASPTRCSPR
jgi:hypothetical protein